MVFGASLSLSRFQVAHTAPVVVTTLKKLRVLRSHKAQRLAGDLIRYIVKNTTGPGSARWPGGRGESEHEDRGHAAAIL
jgi:hypothetical protein